MIYHRLRFYLSSVEVDANFVTHLYGAKFPTKAIGLNFWAAPFLPVLPVQCLSLTQFFGLFCHRTIYFNINEGGKDGPMSRGFTGI